ncbi:MAG: SlyX family protein [Phycisphaerales bacterium]
MPDSPENQTSGDGSRIERLEETVGFIDHTSTQLSEQIASISKEVSVMARRLQSLERRLLDLTDAVTDAPPNVPPPHSAGPDIPRDPL